MLPCSAFESTMKALPGAFGGECLCVSQTKRACGGEGVSAPDRKKGKAMVCRTGVDGTRLRTRESRSPDLADPGKGTGNSLCVRRSRQCCCQGWVLVTVTGRGGGEEAR